MKVTIADPIHICQYLSADGRPRKDGYTVHQTREEAVAEADRAVAKGGLAVALSYRRTCSACGSYLTPTGPLGGGCAECR